MTRFYWPIAKVDAEHRMVWGYASTEAEDDQGETVTREALAAALDDYMRFANIREMHQPSAVGVATEAAIDDRGLYLGAKIIDADAWSKVTAGVYKGFSIGGRVTARDPVDRRLITGLQLTEISVVDRPANPEAVFDCWKRAVATEAATTTRDPLQIWDCGIAGHRHIAKADAARCQAERDQDSREIPDAPDDPPTTGGDPSGHRDYADPGYQADGQQRYPIDEERHIRAAWVYVHQPANAQRYTPAQLERIKQRIVAAWRQVIDPAGPPAAAADGPAGGSDTARKDLGVLGTLVQILGDLDALHDRIAAEAATEGDAPPLPRRLRQINADLRELLRSAFADDGAEWGGPSAGAAAENLAAMAVAGSLRKARYPDLAAVAGDLAKLSGEIVPRLEALQERVDEIARTPLPPQAAARGFAGMAKYDDGGAMAPAEDIVAALARMNDEERTLVLIKAAHANPIVPVQRPPGSAVR